MLLLSCWILSLGQTIDHFVPVVESSILKSRNWFWVNERVNHFKLRIRKFSLWHFFLLKVSQGKLQVLYPLRYASNDRLILASDKLIHWSDKWQVKKPFPVRSAIDWFRRFFAPASSFADFAQVQRQVCPRMGPSYLSPLRASISTATELNPSPIYQQVIAFTWVLLDWLEGLLINAVCLQKPVAEKCVPKFTRRYFFILVAGSGSYSLMRL